jgi:hypothetical protein
LACRPAAGAFVTSPCANDQSPRLGRAGRTDADGSVTRHVSHTSHLSKLLHSRIVSGSNDGADLIQDFADVEPGLGEVPFRTGVAPCWILLSQVGVRLTPIGGRTYAFDCTAAVGTSRQPPGKNKQPAGVMELRSPWARNPAYPSSGRVMVKKRKICAASPGRNGGRCGDARHGEDRAGPASPASADPRSR